MVVSGHPPTSQIAETLDLLSSILADFGHGLPHKGFAFPPGPLHATPPEDVIHSMDFGNWALLLQRSFSS